MKKFTKVSLIIATIFIAIGVVCLVVAAALGLTWSTFGDMVRDGKFNFGTDSFYREEMKGSTAEIDESCNNLDIEFGAGALNISYGDVETIQITQEDVVNYECYVKDNTLHIEGGMKVGIMQDSGTIDIVIPKGMTFHEVDIEVGAGKADIDGVIANQFDIEVGAGQANVTNLDVKEFNAETGAGQLEAELFGKEEDYSYKLECGIGEIRVGNNSYGGLGGAKSLTNPDAERFMNVECGVGQINLTFQE